MDLAEKLEQIPRGNTCPGVNREIIEYLLSLETEFDGEAVLDLPCGEGVFLDTLKAFFPKCVTVGADITPPSSEFRHQFRQIDASSQFSFSESGKFKLATSISGVVEFDNTLSFFRNLKEQLNNDGLLIVTNDNILSVRSRISYLLWGRFAQFPLFPGAGQPTWKIIPLQNLLRTLTDAAFEAIGIKYVPAKLSAWLWLPPAAVLYAFQFLYFCFDEKELPLPEKRRLYPFASLLSRHYIVICRPKK